MSVTILSTPGTHTPANNNQNIVASSTNSTQTNFKYKVTVQINDGFWNPDTILKVPARPDNAKLYYNPQGVDRSYIKSSFSTTATDFFFPSLSDNSSLKKVTIGIDEEYGSPVSGFGGASASYYIWNGAYNAIDFADYTYGITTKAKDLMLSPSLKDTINYDQKYLYKTWHIGFSTRILYRMTIVALDSAGTPTTSIIENQFSSLAGVTGYVKNYITLNCSPYGLNNYTGTFISGTPGAIIPAGTINYTFYFNDNAGPPNVSSNTNTVYINDFCSNYTRYVLHFLNRLGNYDSYTFNMLSRNTTDKTTDEYKQIPYSLTAANKYRYEKYTNDKIIYNTVLSNKLSMESDWIDDDKAAWLRDLFASPDIKLEITDDANIAGDQSALISVKCKLTNYETKLQTNDKLFNFHIDVENDLQDVRQQS